MLSKNRVVLITGCSSGIGLALTRLLYTLDFRVIATAREHSLAKLHQEFKESDRFILRALDVTSFQRQKVLIKEIESLWGGVDVLVNNAGISYRAVIEEMDEENERNQIRTNYLGPIHLVRLVLPHMRQQRFGHIINISSVGGMMAMPTMGSYSASKFALEGASEALWYEMRPWNINVTLIEPGFVHSGSFEHVYLTAKSADLEHSPYAHYYRHMTEFVAELMNMAIATPKSIARRILKVINQRSPPLRVQATWDARVFTILRRILPQPLYHRVLYYSLPGIREWGKEINAAVVDNVR